MTGSAGPAVWVSEKDTGARVAAVMLNVHYDSVCTPGAATTCRSSRSCSRTPRHGCSRSSELWQALTTGCGRTLGDAIAVAMAVAVTAPGLFQEQPGNRSGARRPHKSHNHDRLHIPPRDRCRRAGRPPPASPSGSSLRTGAPLTEIQCENNADRVSLHYGVAGGQVVPHAHRTIIRGGHDAPAVRAEAGPVDPERRPVCPTKRKRAVATRASLNGTTSPVRRT
jgi:hypothetical protein